jgi:hypothetical protein
MHFGAFKQMGVRPERQGDNRIMQVRILDSRPGAGAVAREWEFDSPRITLRELIRRRVADEVEQFNRDRPEIFEGLVQPDESEQILNGYRVKFHYLRTLDAEKQFERAIQAFEKQRFLVIAAGRQVESVDEEIDLSGGEVEFIKLAPLIGG